MFGFAECMRHRNRIYKLWTNIDHIRQSLVWQKVTNSIKYHSGNDFISYQNVNPPW